MLCHSVGGKNLILSQYNSVLTVISLQTYLRFLTYSKNASGKFLQNLIN
jgi:hypothetical protein